MGATRHSLWGRARRLALRWLGAEEERLASVQAVYRLWHQESAYERERLASLRQEVERLRRDLAAMTRPAPATLEVEGWTATLTSPAELGFGPWCVLAVRRDQPAMEPTYGIYALDPASGEAALVTGCSTTGQTVIVEPAFYHLYLPDEEEAPLPDPVAVVIAWGWRYDIKISQDEAEEIASSLEDGGPVRHDQLVFRCNAGGVITAISREARA